MPPLVTDDPGQHQDRVPGNGAPGAPGADDMRARIAAARGEVTGNTPVPGNGPATAGPGTVLPGTVSPGTGGGPAGTALPLIPGVPPEAVAVLMPLLASGRTSAAAAGLALGMSKSAAHRYLQAMRDHGHAETTGAGPPPGGSSEPAASAGSQHSGEHLENHAAEQPRHTSPSRTWPRRSTRAWSTTSTTTPGSSSSRSTTSSAAQRLTLVKDDEAVTAASSQNRPADRPSIVPGR